MVLFLRRGLLLLKVGRFFVVVLLCCCVLRAVVGEGFGWCECVYVYKRCVVGGCSRYRAVVACLDCGGLL